MLNTRLATAAALFVGLVAAHGEVNSVKAGSNTNAAPNIYYAADSKNANTATRKMYQASSPSFVLPTGYRDNSKMSCEGSANSPAPKTISVAAGSTLTVIWEGATDELDGFAGVTGRHPWVHAMGPVIDYMTSCNGDCTKFDATNAGWTKIAQSGIDFSQAISGDLRARMTAKPEKYYPTSGNGLWAMAKLQQQSSTWNIKIPSGLKAGQYLVRHELAAIHNPLGSDPTSGPQHYIACIQVSVTGSGSTSLPSGTQAKDLYSPTGAFAKFDVYSDDIHSFQVPGPAVWDGSSEASNSGSSSSSSGSSAGSGSSSSGSGSGSSSSGGTANVASSPKPASSPASTPKAPAASPASSPASSSSSSSTGKKCKRRVGGRRSANSTNANKKREDGLRFHRAKRSFEGLH